MTKQGEVVLIEQYRPPLDVRVIEFPAGLAGDEPEAQDETLEDAARRELLEETGYAGETLELLTKGPPSPGLCTEVLTFFLATDVEKVEKGGGVEGEDIDVHAVPAGEVEDWLHAREAEGRAVDPKVYTGLFFIERSRSGPRDPG